MTQAYGIAFNDEHGIPLLCFDGKRECRVPMLVSKNTAEYRAAFMNDPPIIHIALREALYQGLGAAPPNARAVPLPYVFDASDIWSD